jgi:aldehyde dehydrogenase (NAD+)
VTGYGEPTGRALVEHPLVTHIAFTGSTRTGQSIAQVAAARSARVSLELGGKSPNIIFADADLELAADGVLAGIFSASGQSCVAGSRILIESSVSDGFLDELTRRTRELRLGDPLDDATQVPPVASRAQLEKVFHYLDVAQQDGATTLAGGRRPSAPELADGFFVEPTLLADVAEGSRVVREEIFGPIGTIIRFDDDDEAIRIANDTEFGLASAIWTESIRRAHRVIPRIQAGTVWVNTYRALEYRRPFGGFKQSGIGRELGIDALDEFTESKSVFIDVTRRSD